MKFRKTALAAGIAAAMLLTAAAAQADPIHVVTPGESLTSVAAVDGLSVDSLASANGLSIDSYLTVGQLLAIPPQGESVSEASTSASTSSEISTGTGGASVTGGEPYGGFVSGSEIAYAAEQYGLSPSLAEAIAWQESGFDNDEVSATGAVGVMQLEPYTVTWINANLTPSYPIDADDPAGNIRGGVLLLRYLLAETGGNEAAAIADYYQGAQSISAYGMFASTQQYVDDVLSLQRSFGG